VIAVEDELREEEVFACVIWKDDSAGLAQAQEIFEYCQSRLAYFKLPGWFLFVDQLPTTDTQKLLKHKIFPEGTDPRGVAGALDFRDQKRRKSITA
jgi:crotonobetaine/carnitine-CoA ligase